MGYSAQNEKGDTAQNETTPMWHRNRKNRWKIHISPKIQLIAAISGVFPAWERVKRQLRMLLAKPVWKPGGDEDSVDLMDFHLNAF